jgi:hypothetical protein
MEHPEAPNELIGPEFSRYRKQISWCPKFLQVFALGPNNTILDKDEYEKKLRTLDSDITVCYAGLLHTEFQTTDKEAKLIRYCDTCNFSTVESKQLAQQITDDYTVDAEALKQVGEEKTIICRCSVCGDTIFEDYRAVVADENGNIRPEFDKQINDHYSILHPDVKDKV